MNYLKESLTIKSVLMQNRVCINPMEGCDSLDNGAPSDLTIRRYEKFAQSGAGLIWFEAVAVCREGRSSANQLYLTEENKESFVSLVKRIKQINPLIKIICQVTHSGRFSKPNGVPEPCLAFRDPYLDERYPAHKNFEPVSDEYLDGLVERYEKTAQIAKEVGFDGIDIKACHRYLMDELLSAHTRKGKYGGSFENRARLIRDVFDAVRKYADDNFILCSRFNAYSAIDYPYGFGVDSKTGKENFEEPIKLLKILQEKGLSMINLTMGTPYYNPHVNKPHKNQFEEASQSVDRLLKGAETIKKNCKGLVVVSTGYTYLKDGAYARANEMIEKGNADIIGFGRLAFAYPNFAKDIVESSKLDKAKCCVCCNKCSELLRAGLYTGCVVKDTETYLPIYLNYAKGKKG